VSINAAFTPSTRPENAAVSGSNLTPACDTTPAPSALTWTRRTRRLPFTYEVPSCESKLELRNPKFPLQDRHFDASTRRVGQDHMKDAG